VPCHGLSPAPKNKRKEEMSRRTTRDMLCYIYRCKSTVLPHSSPHPYIFIIVNTCSKMVHNSYPTPREFYHNKCFMVSLLCTIFNTSFDVMVGRVGSLAPAFWYEEWRPLSPELTQFRLSFFISKSSNYIYSLVTVIYGTLHI